MADNLVRIAERAKKRRREAERVKVVPFWKWLMSLAWRRAK